MYQDTQDSEKVYTPEDPNTLIHWNHVDLECLFYSKTTLLYAVHRRSSF